MGLEQVIREISLEPKEIHNYLMNDRGSKNSRADTSFLKMKLLAPDSLV